MNFFAEVLSGAYPAFRRPFPPHYLVVDIETSGTVPPTDYAILQLGYLLVIDGQPSRQGTILLKPRPGMLVEPRALEVTGLTVERCQSEGLERAAVLPAFLNMITDNLDRGVELVGHNHVKFDLWHLQYEASQYGRDLRVPAHLLFDTGMLAKASAADIRPSMYEDRLAYFMRVSEARLTVKWRLEVCAQRFGLDMSGGFHDAGRDCFCTHLLLQRMRYLADHPEIPTP